MVKKSQKEQHVLDLKDKRIIYELDFNARQSYSRIAKKVGLKRDTVRNRIKNLEKKGIITDYFTMVNSLDLGLTVYKIYLQFHNLSPSDEKTMIEDLKKRINISYVTPLKGNWDLLIAVNTDRISKFNRIFDDILEKYNRFILNKSICMNVDVELYKRDYLLGKEVEKREVRRFADLGERRTLKRIDIDILKILEDNARMSTIDISRKLNLTPRVVSYHIKSLVRDKIVVAFRSSIDIFKSGLEYYKVLIKSENFSIQKERAFKTYCRKLPNCLLFIKTIGSWDYELEFEVTGYTQLNDIMRSIRENFSDVIGTYDTLLMLKEYKFKLLALK